MYVLLLRLTSIPETTVTSIPETTQAVTRSATKKTRIDSDPVVDNIDLSSLAITSNVKKAGTKAAKSKSMRYCTVFVTSSFINLLILSSNFRRSVPTVTDIDVVVEKVAELVEATSNKEDILKECNALIEHHQVSFKVLFQNVELQKRIVGK